MAAGRTRREPSGNLDMDGLFVDITVHKMGCSSVRV